MIQQKLNEIEKFLKSKGFKKKSLNTYTSIINKVLIKLGKNFKEEELEQLFTELDLKPRSYNLYRSVMNFYTKQYLGYELSFTKAKVDKSLPTFVSQEEFNQFLSIINNPKHKLGFKLMYQCGLRVYELCRIKKHNIYFDKYSMLIADAKGGKHRLTFIPKSIIGELKSFLESTEKDNPYLFQTYRGHISERSFQERLKKAIKDSNLTKEFTCHSLRHSFAINLVNKQVDIEFVRKRLGHSCLKTTQIYLQCKTDNLMEIAMVS